MAAVTDDPPMTVQSAGSPEDYRWRVLTRFRGAGRKRRAWFYVRQDHTGAIVGGPNGGPSEWADRASAKATADRMNDRPVVKPATAPGDPLFEECSL